MPDNYYKIAMESRGIAADEVSGVLYPRVKLVWGADNTCTDASAANPLPVVPSALVASTALIGDVSPGIRTTTTNALLGFHRISTADTNQVNVKASAGRLYGISAYNATASAKYVKFHNTAGAPTAGSGVVRTFGIPPNSERDVFLPIGHFFATGIAMTITGAMADADTTALQAGDVCVEVWYG